MRNPALPYRYRAEQAEEARQEAEKREIGFLHSLNSATAKRWQEDNAKILNAIVHGTLADRAAAIAWLRGKEPPHGCAFRCLRRNYWRDILWPESIIVETLDPPPHHFQRLEEWQEKYLLSSPPKDVNILLNPKTPCRGHRPGIEPEMSRLV